MNSYHDFLLKIKLLRPVFLLFSVSFSSGCSYYSWDENRICPFGKSTYESTDYDKPVFVDTEGKKLSFIARKKMQKSASEFSQDIINKTYDTANILCQQQGLDDKQYKDLLILTNTYADSVAVPHFKWDDNRKYYRPKFYRALAENDEGLIITTTLCVIGMCTQSEHLNFCKKNDRPYLKDKILNKKLTEFYIANNKVNIIYPFNKTLSSCSGPKW